MEDIKNLPPENDSTVYDTLLNYLKQHNLIVYREKSEIVDDPEPYYVLVIDEPAHLTLLKEIEEKQIEYYNEQLRKGIFAPFVRTTRLRVGDWLQHPNTQSAETKEGALLKALSAWESSGNDSAAQTFDG